MCAVLVGPSLPFYPTSSHPQNTHTHTPEERHEVRDGDFQVHHRGNLPIRQPRQAELLGPEPVGAPGVERRVEHEEGGEAGHAPQRAGDGEEHGEVPPVRRSVVVGFDCEGVG